MDRVHSLSQGGASKNVDWPTRTRSKPRGRPILGQTLAQRLGEEPVIGAKEAFITNVGMSIAPPENGSANGIHADSDRRPIPSRATHPPLTPNERTISERMRPIQEWTKVSQAQPLFESSDTVGNIPQINFSERNFSKRPNVLSSINDNTLGHTPEMKKSPSPLSASRSSELREEDKHAGGFFTGQTYEKPRMF